MDQFRTIKLSELIEEGISGGETISLNFGKNIDGDTLVAAYRRRGSENYLLSGDTLISLDPLFDGCLAAAKSVLEEGKTP